MFVRIIVHNCHT